jgi:hypothetical protein
MNFIAQSHAALDGHMILFSACKQRRVARKNAVEGVLEELKTMQGDVQKTIDYVDQFPTAEGLEARVQLFHLERRVERMKARFLSIYESAAREEMIVIW